MARTDRQRWLDWRSNGGRPLRPIRTCRACRVEFLPDTIGQAFCLRCVQAEVERQQKERERQEREAAEAAAERAALQKQEHAFDEMRRRLSEPPPPPKRMSRNWKGRESATKKMRRLAAMDETARPRRDGR
jgi:hypothetical protein